MVDLYALFDGTHKKGLFEASFECTTLVQIFMVIHCIWVGVMGTLCTIDPSWSPITENGLFTRGKEKFQCPNVRGGWNVRGGSMFIVAAGALYVGTRETYLIYLLAAIWRENYDCIELMLFRKNAYQIVFRFWKSPIGLMPPLISFLLMNVLAFWSVLKAE